MNLSAARLQRILAEAPIQFRTGDYISRGFQFMNENLGLLIAFTIVSSLINFFCQSLPYVGIFLGVAISPVLNVGYAQFCYMVSRGHKADFGEFFKGFTKIGPLLLTYLIMAVISLFALLPGLLVWYKAGMFDWALEMIDAYPLFQEIPELGEMVDMSLFWIGFALLFISGLIVSLLFLWSLQIAWFFDVGPLEALSASRKLIANNWANVLGFLIITGIITVSGVLLCGIGLLYTAPAMACAQFFAFADATHILEDDDHKSDLLDHFIA